MIKPLKRKAYLIKSLNQQWSQKCRSISIRRIVIRWIVVSPFRMIMCQLRVTILPVGLSPVAIAPGGTYASWTYHIAFLAFKGKKPKAYYYFTFWNSTISVFLVRSGANQKIPKNHFLHRLNFEVLVIRLHDDSANDDSAIDKMAARFWHTDDTATFLFEKKAKKNFLPLTDFHLKTFPTPYGCQKWLTLPLTGFFYPWRELIFTLKKLFLTPNLLQISKNGLNWPSFSV